MDVLTFLLKSSVVSALLYLPYATLLKKRRFFQVNRWYLLCIFPLTLLLLAFPPSFFSTSWAANYAPSFNDPTALLANPVDPNVARSVSAVSFWPYILLLVYALGILVSLFASFKGFWNLRKLALSSSESNEYPESGFRIFRSALLQTPFSFMQWLFLPKALEGKQLQVVLAHEQLHLKYRHSIDRMFHELWKALFWFNPIAYSINRSIRTNHEFQVDDSIIKEQFSITEYLQSIASFTYHQPGSMAVNTFKSKNIKKRILMMNQQKHSKKSLWIYFLVLPLALIASLAFVIQNENHTPSIEPIKDAEITSGYGMRNNPITNEAKLHGGADFRSPLGTQVMATAKGTVVKAEEEGKWGNLIIIKHGDTYETWYAHLQSIDVKKGDVVTEGSTIGSVGNTGMSTAPHLHYEVRKNGERVDPETYLGK